jgi:putative tricarboxylic transport membrane protein
MTDSKEIPQKDSAKDLMKSMTAIGVILVIAIYLFVLAGSIDQAPIPGQLGPAFWPRCILVLLMLSCVFKAVEVYKEGRKKQERDYHVGYRHAAKEEQAGALDQAAAAEGGGTFATVDVPKLSFMIVACLVVVFLMDYTGFIIANALFTFIFCYMVGDRKWKRLIVISVLGTIGLLYLFAYLVYVPLPKGHFFFEDFTLMIYRALFII